MEIKKRMPVYLDYFLSVVASYAKDINLTFVAILDSKGNIITKRKLECTDPMYAKRILTAQETIAGLHQQEELGDKFRLLPGTEYFVFIDSLIEGKTIEVIDFALCCVKKNEITSFSNIFLFPKKGELFTRLENLGKDISKEKNIKV